MAKGKWQSILRQLVASGFLEMDVREYGSLKLTRLGHDLNKGEAEFKYREFIEEGKKGDRQDPI